MPGSSRRCGSRCRSWWTRRLMRFLHTKRRISLAPAALGVALLLVLMPRAASAQSSASDAGATASEAAPQSVASGSLHMGMNAAAEAGSVRLTLNPVHEAHVSVYVKEFNSQRVAISGEVVRPGLYPVLTSPRLYDLFLAAGGLTN